MVINVSHNPLTWRLIFWSLFGVRINTFARRLVSLLLYPSTSSFMMYIWISMCSVLRCGRNWNRLTMPRWQPMGWRNPLQRWTTVLAWIMQMTPSWLMVFGMYLWKNDVPFWWVSIFNPFVGHGWVVILLWVKRSKNNYWVCSGRATQPLVVEYYFLVMLLRVMADSMLSLIFERGTLLWVRDESILA